MSSLDYYSGESLQLKLDLYRKFKGYDIYCVLNDVDRLINGKLFNDIFREKHKIYNIFEECDKWIERIVQFCLFEKERKQFLHVLNVVLLKQKELKRITPELLAKGYNIQKPNPKKKLKTLLNHAEKVCDKMEKNPVGPGYHDVSMKYTLGNRKFTQDIYNVKAGSREQAVSKAVDVLDHAIGSHVKLEAVSAKSAKGYSPYAKENPDYIFHKNDMNILKAAKIVKKQYPKFYLYQELLQELFCKVDAEELTEPEEIADYILSKIKK